jgi:hypothetical protein
MEAMFVQKSTSELHGVTTEIIALSTVTAVPVSNPIHSRIYGHKTSSAEGTRNKLVKGFTNNTVLEGGVLTIQS